MEEVKASEEDLRTPKAEAPLVGANRQKVNMVFLVDFKNDDEEEEGFFPLCWSCFDMRYV